MELIAVVVSLVADLVALLSVGVCYRSLRGDKLRKKRKSGVTSFRRLESDCRGSSEVKIYSLSNENGKDEYKLMFSSNMSEMRRFLSPEAYSWKISFIDDGEFIHICWIDKKFNEDDMCLDDEAKMTWGQRMAWHEFVDEKCPPIENWGK